MNGKRRENQTARDLLANMLLSAASLFGYGFGVYLTIQADIGAGPWDVFSLGLAHTFGIRYGTASIAVSFAILLIDVLMREPIGISMFLDAVIVGKTVDLFQSLSWIQTPGTVWGSVLLILLGLTVMGYTQLFYMESSLGCGPRDTLLVGLKRRLTKVPIGVVGSAILLLVTGIGYALGGKVGIGTLLCAFGSGPIMQFAFLTFRFDATAVRHQNLVESLKVIGVIRNRR